MTHLTVRKLPPELGEALEKEKKRRGTSLNETVIQLLEQGLGLGEGGPPRNGLRRLAGSWSAEELERFEEATAVTEEIDEEVWR